LRKTKLLFQKFRQLKVFRHGWGKVRFACFVIQSLKEALGPAEIQRRLFQRNLRIGTVVEAIAFMGLRNKKELRIMVFARYGSDQHPCAVFFFKKGNSFQMSIMHNNDTSVWQPGCDILVYDA